MKTATRSKTLWLNVATLGLLAVSAASLGLGDLGIEPIWQARILYATNIINAVLNGVLRLHTYQPIAGTMGAQKARSEPQP